MTTGFVVVCAYWTVAEGGSGFVWEEMRMGFKGGFVVEFGFVFVIKGCCLVYFV